MKPVGVGVVGLGMVAGTHLAALGELPQARVVGVTARDPARRAAFAAAHGVPEAPGVDALLADPAVEALFVLTPPDSHLDLARAAFAAGKAVLLEKPLAASLADARALVAGADDAPLGVCFQSRFRAGAAAAIRLVDSGRLGDLVGGSVQVPMWRPQDYYDAPGRGTRARDGGGVLLTQAIHTLDLLIRLAGIPAGVRAAAGTSPVHRMETEDHAAALLDYPGGAAVALWATTCARPGWPEQIDLVFTGGTLRLTGPRLHAALADGTAVEADDPATTGGTGAAPMSFGHLPHKALIADFLDALRTGRAPAVTGQDGLNAQALVEAILSAAATGARAALRVAD